MIESLLLALILILAVGYVVAKLPPSNCTQDCKQGRKCNCGDR